MIVSMWQIYDFLFLKTIKCTLNNHYFE